MVVEHIGLAGDSRAALIESKLKVVQYRTYIRYGKMRFVVRFLRSRGRILPWRDVMNQTPKYGDLRIEECLDRDLHRYVRAARLFDEGNVLSSNNLPELLDVRLMAMSQQAFTLTGFERTDGVEYAQSWLVCQTTVDVIRNNRNHDPSAS